MSVHMNTRSGQQLCSVVSLLAGLWLTTPLAAQSDVGVIAGRIVDTAGKPVADISIVVTPVPGSTGSLATSSGRVDSDGRYRMTVRPGRYHVKAGMCRGFELPGCPTDAPIYVYHPGTRSRDSATVITVGAGTTRDEVDLVLNAASITAMRDEAERLRSMAYGLSSMRYNQPSNSSPWRSLDDMHNYFVATFIATPGMGSGRMGRMFLQLDPGQRLLLPDEGSTSDAARPSAPTTAWSVNELELIGIAKHERPVVFSRIAHGTGESERSLSEFEQQSLAALRSGRNIISRRGDGGAMLLVGAIRAQSGCLQCHQSQREGDLLGAFRYVMRKAADASSPAAAR